MTGEKSLQAYVMKKCRDLSFLCYKFASPAKRGVPDLILIDTSGVTTYCEVKSPTGRGVLSALQQREIAKLRKQGCFVAIVNSKNDADKFIGQLVCNQLRRQSDTSR